MRAPNRKGKSMANLSKTTRDHEEIRRWAEERGGKPAHVKRTGSEEDIGVLRIEFPGFGEDENLEPISWEDFFGKFDERDLALVYQEQTAGGERSNFNKLVSAETAAESEGGKRGRKSARGGTKGGTKKAATRRSAASTKKAAKSSGKKTSRKAAPKKSSSRTTARKKSAVKKSSSRKSAARKSSGRKRR